MRLVLISILALILVGCATSYQPKGFSGGFSSSQLDTNVFSVSFSGNGFTSREVADDYVLLRGAELALQNGFKYFAVVNSAKHSDVSYHTTPTTATTTLNTNTYGSAYSYGNNLSYNANTYGTATTTVQGGHTYQVNKPISSLTIVCFEEKPEDFSFNAEFLAKSLKEKHGIAQN